MGIGSSSGYDQTVEFCYYPAPPPEFLEESYLTLLPEDPCPYLPDRRARMRAFAAERIHPLLYHWLMDRGFRRSGSFFYQPACRGCRQCIPLRVPVSKFKPSKSQRRAARRNQDLDISVSRLDELSQHDELAALFALYQQGWHGRRPEDVVSEADSLLEGSPVDTLVFRYREPGGRLVAVGICDVCPHSLSSVYFFFDPAEAVRSLGTFGALYEIGFANRHGIPYYYLGYWVEHCAAMTYKARYRPHELLGTDGTWRPGPDSAAPTGGA